jgi:hypothetical protein
VSGPRVMTPREQGENDRKDGRKISQAPYAKGTKPFRQWLAGWQELPNTGDDA